jgi:hypothetical protein
MLPNPCPSVVKILERQARRDAIRKMAETPPSAPQPDDSKYLPPE